MEPIWIVSILVGLILLILITGGIQKAFKLLGSGIVRFLIGALLLFFANIIGAQFGLHVPINLITTAVAGLLGVCGVGALVVINLWIM
ncbi:pro-sigmaK processing inhibitor BofA family protein [Priestia endophytica]|uniref:pro-sigmaK processing inhibitor BofA family protein n=1 Tax=Priestia filamentosa TaxID=1402861 RepID=UPI002E1CBFE5|nr:pro-sigmaK processing inhibitor BofA family protein [Priestia filamentosa]